MSVHTYSCRFRSLTSEPSSVGSRVAYGSPTGQQGVSAIQLEAASSYEDSANSIERLRTTLEVGRREHSTFPPKVRSAYPKTLGMR